MRSERRFEKALVTGAAGGMGTELCRLLAEGRVQANGSALLPADLVCT